MGVPLNHPLVINFSIVNQPAMDPPKFQQIFQECLKEVRGTAMSIAIRAVLQDNGWSWSRLCYVHFREWCLSENGTAQKPMIHHHFPHEDVIKQALWYDLIRFGCLEKQWSNHNGTTQHIAEICRVWLSTASCVLVAISKPADSKRRWLASSGSRPRLRMAEACQRTGGLWDPSDEGGARPHSEEGESSAESQREHSARPPFCPAQLPRTCAVG